MVGIPPPGRRRTALIAVAAASFLSGVLAWRDLASRPADLVRGSKRLWRAAIVANPGNSYAYWLLGRRSPG